ncbi:hypothetical protein K1719_031265 [Acacia pycnantha]|nr:hypothetical protein K1719_031265 [Acacia pycnantha]
MSGVEDGNGDMKSGGVEDGGPWPAQERKSREKFQVLVETLKPVPFIPAKTLDFTSHETLLRRLGLWDFVHIEFDTSIRSDLVAQLIAGYTPSLRSSYVNGMRIMVNRADLGRALKLPVKKTVVTDDVLEKLDLAESISFIEEVVSNWMLLYEDTYIMPTEVLVFTKTIKEGHLEKVDWAGLIWQMVEKELKSPQLVNCYYASHLQQLIKVQREEFLREEPKVEMEVKDEEEEEEEDDCGGGDLKMSGVEDGNGDLKSGGVEDGGPWPNINVSVSDASSRRGPKRKRMGRKRTAQERKSREKFQVLVETLKPVPFIPAKTLDFMSQWTLLWRLGLWDFVHIEFDRSIRSDLVAQLIAGYTPSSRSSYVNGMRIMVNRADLGRALKLPVKKTVVTDDVLEKLDLAESISFIEEVVSNWMLLHEDTYILPTEVLVFTKSIKEGHLEKVDWAGLIWQMVEKELKSPQLVNCYYASHLQQLIKVQREEFLREEPKVEMEVKDEEEEQEEDDCGGGDLKMSGVEDGNGDMKSGGVEDGGPWR